MILPIRSVLNIAAADFTTISNAVNTSSFATRFARRFAHRSWEKAKEKGLWKGVDVRMAQAGWQTVWMVVVPSLMRG